jgi:hypothetical protein
MLTLSFQGSTIKVDQPSEILVTANGVTINPFGKPKAIRKLESVAEAIGNALPDMDKPVGRKKDPNSLFGRIEAFANGLKGSGMSRAEIIAQIKKNFSDANPATVGSYAYVATAPK